MLSNDVPTFSELKAIFEKITTGNLIAAYELLDTLHKPFWNYSYRIIPYPVYAREIYEAGLAGVFKRVMSSGLSCEPGMFWRKCELILNELCQRSPFADAGELSMASIVRPMWLLSELKRIPEEEWDIVFFQLALGTESIVRDYIVNNNSKATVELKTLQNQHMLGNFYLGAKRLGELIGLWAMLRTSSSHPAEAAMKEAFVRNHEERVLEHEDVFARCCADPGLREIIEQVLDEDLDKKYDPDLVPKATEPIVNTPDIEESFKIIKRIVEENIR